ncbi:predicted protein [Arabidopsis lyrata subsp. lyrata]|uniref:Predicted protein n=1 Tax=Arabidopsis lyrata subsp. lyrata TaxID=81972 RepID=D7KTN7_ARALL|nr:predicted protein [Arabidopsis lyrata subsp. lyrata]
MAGAGSGFRGLVEPPSSGSAASGIHKPGLKFYWLWLIGKVWFKKIGDKSRYVGLLGRDSSSSNLLSEGLAFWEICGGLGSSEEGECGREPKSLGCVLAPLRLPRSCGLDFAGSKVPVSLRQMINRIRAFLIFPASFPFNHFCNCFDFLCRPWPKPI